MDMSEMLELWKEWGGSVWHKKAGVRRSDSKWAPENLSKQGTGFSSNRSVPKSSVPQSRRDNSESVSPAPRPDKGKKRQSLAEVDGLPFKKQAAEFQGRSDDAGLSADAINMEDMSAGEVFFNTCMAEKMNSAD